ncbi:hypothetical protein N8258_01235 [Algibacter sp.]|nr:MerR family transcriptional regulator [Algibacter sp.]MDA9069182.1 hypothetical protein [Algibacter sp.]MDC1365022.1 hypothetical protein [Algibacter sp.]
MNFKDRKNIFPASDWFDINFFGGFLRSDSKIKDQLNNQEYPVGNDKISSRVLNHWYEMGIVTDDRPNGKGWKKFSFSEIVWIEIVMQLRSFGFDLLRIKQVKKQIEIFNTKDNKSKCPLLDFYLVVTLTSDIPVKLIVFESGQAEIVREVDIELANLIQSIQEDFISIDLNKLVNKLRTKGASKDFKIDDLNYDVSQIAKEIERSLSIEDVKSVTIKVNDKDYIIGEQFFIKDKIKAKALMSLLKFGELIEKKNDGKSTYQVTNKRKLKK